MAKLTRKSFSVFGMLGSATNFGKFGSQAAGSAVKTMDIELIQSLAAWGTGWTAAVNVANKAPFIEDMNGAMLVLAYQSGYILQEGIPEWNTAAIYFIGSIVKKTGTAELYSSLTDTNAANALPNKVDNTKWKYLGDLKNILPDDVGLEVNGTSGKLQLKDSGVTTAKIAADAVDKTKINADVAGDGLGQNVSGALEVKTDGATIETNTDALRVKAAGIGAAHVSGVLGSYAGKSNDTKYEATTDGFVAVLIDGSTSNQGDYGIARLFIGSSADIDAGRYLTSADSNLHQNNTIPHVFGGFVTPVNKGQYWKVITAVYGNITVTTRWIPLGS